MDKEMKLDVLSKLISEMSIKGATEEELLNVVEFSKVVIKDQLEEGLDIFEFELLNEYRNKYLKG